MHFLAHAVAQARTRAQVLTMIEDRPLEDLKDIARQLNLKVIGDSPRDYIRAIVNTKY